MSFPPRQPPPIISMGPMPPMMQNPYGYRNLLLNNLNFSNF